MKHSFKRKYTYYEYRSCISKRRFSHRKLALTFAKMWKTQKFDIYYCSFCDGYHLATKKRKKKRKKNDMGQRQVRKGK